MENTAQTKWGIDPTHSEVSFKVKHLMITNVKGVFKTFNGSVVTTGSHVPSHVEFALDTESVDTGVADRDAHLRSADFFDAANHKQITFKSTSTQKVDDENFVLHGELSIRGVSHPVKLDVEFSGMMKDPWGNEKAGYAISGKINRKDWGLNWNAALEAGGVLVSDEVKLNCEVQLVRVNA